MAIIVDVVGNVPIITNNIEKVHRARGGLTWQAPVHSLSSQQRRAFGYLSRLSVVSCNTYALFVYI